LVGRQKLSASTTAQEKKVLYSFIKKNNCQIIRRKKYFVSVLEKTVIIVMSVNAYFNWL